MTAKATQRGLSDTATTCGTLKGDELTMTLNDACETPMADHVARFIRELGRADNVQINRLNALKCYDTSNFGPAEAKAVAQEVTHLQSRIDGLVKALEAYGRFSIQSTFDAKGTYTQQKAVELNLLHAHAATLRAQEAHEGEKK